MRLHRVADSVERHKNKFGDYLEIISIAQLIVNGEHKLKEKSKFWNKKDRKVYFCVYINFDTDKIQGQFTKEMFSAAAHEYINQNERATIGVYLKKKDLKGKFLYNYETAYKQVQADLMDEFYGNAK